jgi:hypothetical protein
LRCRECTQPNQYQAEQQPVTRLRKNHGFHNTHGFILDFDLTGYKLSHKPGLKGHGFSRAATDQQRLWASDPEEPILARAKERL